MALALDRFSDLYHHAYSAQFPAVPINRTPDRTGLCWICGRATRVYQAGIATMPAKTFTEPVVLAFGQDHPPNALCASCWWLAVTQRTLYRGQPVTLPFRLGWDPVSLHRISGVVACPIQGASYGYVLTPAGFAQLPDHDLTAFLFEALPRPIQVTVGQPRTSSWARVLRGPVYLGGPVLPVFRFATQSAVAIPRALLTQAEALTHDLPRPLQSRAVTQALVPLGASPVTDTLADLLLLSRRVALYKEASS